MQKLYFLLFCFFNMHVYSQSYQWTWVNGDNTTNQNGNYGTQGVASFSNKPGSRYLPLMWSDASGNIWLLGGYGFPATGTTANDLNDLWEYNTSTGIWTWISGSNAISQYSNYGTRGVPSTTNYPGGREQSATTVDANGNFYYFGGRGFAVSGARNSLNELWKYKPSTGEWTWITGKNGGGQFGSYGTLGVANSTNVPGARVSSGLWMDASGNFWVFGGYGKNDNTSNPPDDLNDLWLYNPTTDQWTWVGGSSSQEQPGTYGTKGTASSSNSPGGRSGYAYWTDASGNFWLFGGNGYDANGTSGELNDLWKFNPTTRQWTWVSGDNTVNQNGVYGTKGLSASSNKPGSRDGVLGWNDPNGNFYIFGGQGYPSSGGGVYATLDDIWKYNPTSNQWTWLAGDNTSGSAGNYGTKGTTSPSNIPPSRDYGGAGKDNSGNLYVFGGAISGGYGNDLWKFSAFSTLPIRFLQFSGKKLNDHIQLTWSTADEINSKFYIIERSFNGRNFDSIGMVHAMSNSRNIYTYTDSWMGQKSYYRIKEVDIDGSFEYSSIVEVQISDLTDIDFKFKQNPVSGPLLVTIQSNISSQTTLQVFNSSGLSIFSKIIYLPKGTTSYQLDTHAFTKGYYFFTLYCQNKNISKSFVKQ